MKMAQARLAKRSGDNVLRLRAGSHRAIRTCDLSFTVKENAFSEGSFFCK
jgi:hypothetical protein